MSLFRMIYVRAGRVRTATLAAASAEVATRLADKLATSWGGYLLTVKFTK